MKSLIKKLTPKFILDVYYSAWPFLGALVYKNPSKKIKIIGITGTNGKTTVTHITSKLLEDAGYNVASISSLRFKIGKEEERNKLKMTMPGRMKIQKFLRDAVDAGCDYCVMEVTSEGIKQKRHKFINFDTAVFTNLTKEHIESHGSFENYRAAKGEFFAMPHSTSIVNVDDKNSDYFLGFDAEVKVGYTLKDSIDNNRVNKLVKAKDVDVGVGGISFNLRDTTYKTKLLGRFNAYNILAAICVAESEGVDKEKTKESLERFKGIPGRMEVVLKEPTVVVDYAHTPDALKKMYSTLTKLKHPDSRVIGVLGAAGGGRDKWKRSELGKIADSYCDKIILTDEDPYQENPETILDNIEEGIADNNGKVLRILDRREAINRALREAKKHDVVAITGKGAEPLLMTKDGGIDWDDREVVRQEMGKIIKLRAANK